MLAMNRKNRERLRMASEAADREMDRLEKRGHPTAKPSQATPTAKPRASPSIAKAPKPPASSTPVPAQDPPTQVASASAKPSVERTNRRPRVAREIPTLNGEEEIVIGLDWGTHSTKVAFRRELSEKSSLLVMQPRPDNECKAHIGDAPYPWFAIPSVLAVRDDRFVFGDNARSTDLSMRLYALKSSLFKGYPKVSHSFLKRIDTPDELEAEEVLSAVFLSWVLGLVRQQLDTLIGRGRWRPFVVVGAPMSSVENHQLKSRYLDVLHAAYLTAFAVDDFLVVPEWQVGRVSRHMQVLLRAQLPDSGERRFAVVPETTAGLVPVHADPRLDAGFYNVVDIGGGSTELSVFCLGKSGTPRIDCLADTSVPLGANDFQEFAARPEFEEKLKTIQRELRRVWGIRYKEEAKNRNLRKYWSKQVVVKAGGGWIHPKIESSLREGHPCRDYFKKIPFFMNYSPPQELLDVAPTVYVPQDVDRRMFHLLPVAIGLSRLPNWPDNEPASTAPPVEPDADDSVSPDASHGHS
jgi:hypothetical protein